MSLFRKKGKAKIINSFSLDRYEPVIRSSVCTGEITACMRDRESGKLREVMLIQNDTDLKTFAEETGVDLADIRTVY